MLTARAAHLHPMPTILAFPIIAIHVGVYVHLIASLLFGKDDPRFAGARLIYRS